MKVLIAEDSALLADVLEEVLTRRGYEVVGIARTVKEAVALADLHSPELAVLDYRLAQGGLGTHIRPLLADKLSVGILFVSADPLETILTSEDGDAYIQKPYMFDQLIEALRLVENVRARGIYRASGCPSYIHLLQASTIPQAAA